MIPLADLLAVLGKALAANLQQHLMGHSLTPHPPFHRHHQVLSAFSSKTQQLFDLPHGSRHLLLLYSIFFIRRRFKESPERPTTYLM